MQGEKIGHETTGDTLLCPKKVLRRQVAHLRHHGAPADTHIACFKTPRGSWTNVSLSMITDHLKATVKLLAETHLGFTHKYVSARSLQAAGAMALLCSGVDTDIISLIERWRSEEMLRYFRVNVGGF